MSSVAVVVVVVVAIFAASMLGAWLRGGGPQSDIKGIHEEMQRLLTTQAQGFSAQMGQVTQLVTQQLAEVRRELDQGVSNTGQITADAQREMTQQLRDSTEALSQLKEHLGKVQQSGHELTEAAQTMHAVLGGPKSYGVLGETQLHDLLGDVLPGSSYELDHQFSNGETASAVLHAGRKLVAIDAAFPVDPFRDLLEQGEEARGEFAQAVREHVDKVSQSYVLPDEGTLDLALMFVPSESAFVELLRTGNKKGRLEEYCRQKHVLPVSPNSLHAYLGAVLIGLRGMEFEDNAKRMLANLEGVKKQFEAFGRAHAEIGNRLQETREAYEVAGQQLVQTKTALAATAPAEETAEAEETAPAQQISVEVSNNGDQSDS